MTSRSNPTGNISEESSDELKAFDKRWEAKYIRLKNYYDSHGHSNCPARYEKDPGLGNWVREQRRKYKKNKVSKYRIDKLEAIEFSWKPSEKKRTPAANRKPKATKRSCDPQSYDEKWLVQYNKLKDFKRQHGHCRVPTIYHPDRTLGNWVHQQRTLCSRGSLSRDRKQLLDEIGFNWSGSPELKAKTDGCESSLIGTMIRAEFDTGWFDGVITQKCPGGYWRVEYTDGQYENIPEAELQRIIMNYEEYHGKKSSQGSREKPAGRLVGTKVRKEFNWGWYDGVVTQAKPKQDGWIVEYSDGGKECVTEEEVEDLAADYHEQYSRGAAGVSEEEVPCQENQSDECNTSFVIDSEVSLDIIVGSSRGKKRRNRLYDHHNSSKRHNDQSD